MKNLVILLLLFTFGHSFAQRGSGAQENQYTKTVNVIICSGQSNPAGRGIVEQLANVNYNYYGISTGYPSVRAGQPTYTVSPSGIYTYWKGNDRAADMSIDNGVWQAYQAGVNSSPDGVLATFGPELSLATQLRIKTGNDVYIIKYAIGGTALNVGGASQAPGVWNYLNRTTAVEYYIRRAIRDLRIQQPNTKIVLQGILWWQGETDGENNSTTANYQQNFTDLVRYYNQGIKETFLTSIQPQWYVMKLNYNSDSKEANVNAAISNVVSLNSGTMTLVNVDAYPKYVTLTADEKAPYTGTGYANHTSYIGVLAAGEKILNLIYPN